MRPPSFWLALLLIGLFAVKCSLVTVARRQGSASALLPIFALVLTPAAILTRFARLAMPETLEENYIRTARVKGLPGWLVVGRHALRNSLTSVLAASETSLWAFCWWGRALRSVHAGLGMVRYLSEIA